MKAWVIKQYLKLRYKYMYRKDAIVIINGVPIKVKLEPMDKFLLNESLIHGIKCKYYDILMKGKRDGV